MKAQICRWLIGVAVLFTTSERQADVQEIQKIELGSDTPFLLIGHVAHPKGVGPFPAVVIQQPCAAYGDNATWLRYFTNLGFAALVFSGNESSIQRACQAKNSRIFAPAYRSLGVTKTNTPLEQESVDNNTEELVKLFVKLADVDKRQIYAIGQTEEGVVFSYSPIVDDVSSTDHDDIAGIDYPVNCSAPFEKVY